MSATVFVIGALVGVTLQGAFDRGTIASATATRQLAGAASSATGTAGEDRGVADNNMSDAARLATYCDHD